MDCNCSFLEKKSIYDLGWLQNLVNKSCWNQSIFNNIEHDRQEKEIFYHSSYVHEVFISAVSLLNDLKKILVEQFMSATWNKFFLQEKKCFWVKKFKIEVPIFCNLSPKFELTDKLYQ